MSLATARQPLVREPAPIRDPGPARRPQLRIVRAQAPARSRVPFLALCVSILVGSLLAALALNTSMAATAYTLRERQGELTALSQEEQRLASLVEETSAPSAVMASARALGMQPSDGVVHLRLADGTLIGAQG
ncbi:conserved hypothetical protein [Beutenbergia cavernae DSM 12333]|uniref:Cell division protein FtsL n=1 Tax=Beutenbergia cavernae (strain ATCC BAA-8 / DSM 12333 / CCUG 43141 / JCM 11478 / NBRC 16432 / NCIMB 13614 / HKI 0122) TaxID=471853 RepID=C5BW66_BEUC1|nr:hypothetical protein [Beutenbergia cavernae]ACQ80667.1 conserved hypothetical protein [Beutenbergia cavernae DSM 12333]